MAHSHCDRILRLYLTNNVREVQLDLTRLKFTSDVDLPLKVVREISRKFNVADEKCPNLVKLEIKGGNLIHSDTLIEEIEDLAHILLRKAPNLRELRLPVLSNRSALTLAKLENLVSLKSDRTKHFTYKGLDALTKSKPIQFINLGLFKHKLFNKLDALKFLDQKRQLKSYSFSEEDRLLLSNGGGNFTGEKVFTYSALRLAILGLPHDKHRMEEDFVCFHNYVLMHAN